LFPKYVQSPERLAAGTKQLPRFVRSPCVPFAPPAQGSVSGQRQAWSNPGMVADGEPVGAPAWPPHITPTEKTRTIQLKLKNRAAAFKACQSSKVGGDRCPIRCVANSQRFGAELV